MDKKVFVKNLEALVAEISEQNGIDVTLARGLLNLVITKNVEMLKTACKVG